MSPGMVFTIEPCVSEGGRRVKTLEDGWTAVTLVSEVILLFLFKHSGFRIIVELPNLNTQYSSLKQV